MTVYHAVVLQEMALDHPDAEDYKDEDTIGIYTTEENAEAGISRYIAGARLDDPEYNPEDYGDEFVVRSVELDTDLIFIQDEAEE